MPDSLEDVQDGIVERLHAGEPVDRNAVLREHPEHAEALGAFFSLLDAIGEPNGVVDAAPSRLGEFQVIREVGRGGMGIVYEAEQISLKRRVALKVLPPVLGRDSRVLVRFRREAEAAAKLRHPNIVPVYTVGELSGTPFFAMELVEGRSLAQVIEDRRSGGDAGLAPAGPEWRRWCVETAATVADALAYAHGRGILHRDVKPGNILLEKDGTPRLTDFGLALDLEAVGLTLAGEVFGSPQYMSPEQAFRRQAPLDQRTDVYSLAVTLYEMLTLGFPYEGTTTAEILTSLSSGRLVPPRERDPEISPDLERILLHALMRDPASRYASAEDFARDLRASAQGRPVAAPSPRRRGRTRALVAASVLVAAALGAVGFSLSRRSPSVVCPDLWRPAGADVVRLAQGNYSEGEALLKRWIDVQVHARRVVSRRTPGRLDVSIDVPVPGDVPAGYRVGLLKEASVDGGPWQPVGSSDPHYNVLSGGSVLTLSGGSELREILGDALAQPSARIAQRVTVRVLAVGGGDDRSSFVGGTSATWTFEQDFVIYDDYPPEYPEAVSGAAEDAKMRECLTPAVVHYTAVREMGDRTGKRRQALKFMFVFRNQGGPLPVACEVEVRHVATGTVLGAFDFVRHGCETPSAGQQAVGTWLPLGALPPEEEARMLLALNAGKTIPLQFIFRPSRRVALEQTIFDRYWAGTLDVRAELDPNPPMVDGRVPPMVR